MSKATAIIAVVSTLVFVGVLYGPLDIGAIGLLVTILFIGLVAAVVGEIASRLK